MPLLFVENNARFARIAAREFLGNYEVVLVPTVKAAREQLQKARFDVVLLDYDLDEGKGVELLTDIEKLAVRPFVVATSAYDELNAILKRAGADAVCNKTRFRELPWIIDEHRMSQAKSSPM